MPPLVSIVIPCFNQARYLHESIGSLQAQSLSEWECVIVDDGSTDETRRVGEELARSDRRVRYMFQENAGPSAARNSGVRVTGAPFVQFLDADDLLQKGKLKEHVAFLQQNPEIGVVYGDVRYFPDGKREEEFFGVWGEEEPWVEAVAELDEPLLEKVLSRNLMAMNCPIFRRSTLENVGSFSETVLGCEDWEYFIRCALAGVRFQFLPIVGTMALVRSHARSTSRDVQRMLEGEFRFRLALGQRLEQAQLRVENFERAARCLRQIEGRSYLPGLLRAAQANSCTRVYVYALLRLLDRQDRIRTLLRGARENVFASAKGNAATSRRTQII